MKFWVCILLLVVLFATGGVTAQTCDPDSVAVTEYKRYEASDAQWAVLIIPPKTKRDCVIALTQKLHNHESTVRFEFFDARGIEIDQYIRWAESGDDAYYPEKWLKKHHIATLYVFSDGRGPRDCAWTLKFEKGSDAAIGRGPCS